MHKVTVDKFINSNNTILNSVLYANRIGSFIKYIYIY